MRACFCCRGTRLKSPWSLHQACPPRPPPAPPHAARPLSCNHAAGGRSRPHAAGRTGSAGHGAADSARRYGCRRLVAKAARSAAHLRSDNAQARRRARRQPCADGDARLAARGTARTASAAMDQGARSIGPRRHTTTGATRAVVVQAPPSCNGGHRAGNAACAVSRTSTTASSASGARTARLSRRQRTSRAASHSRPRVVVVCQRPPPQHRH